MSGVVCKNDACQRPLRVARDGSGTFREFCYRCAERAKRKAESTARAIARGEEPRVSPARFRTNKPVTLGAHERFVQQFAIGSFLFILTNRSLFFAHGATIDEVIQTVGVNRTPSIHRVHLQRGIA